MTTRALFPWSLSARDWKEVLRRLMNELRDDQVSVIAAGMAFFMVLALLPLFALAISLYGLFTDPSLVEEQIRVLATLVPPMAWEVIAAGLSKLSAQEPGVLGFGFLLGLAGSFWAVWNGALTMIRGVNIAYDTVETRSFVRLRWIAFQLTIAILLFGAVAFVLLALLPLFIEFLGLQASEELVARLARWPLLLVTALFGLALVYRFTPNRPKPKWRWVTPGSLLATVVWLIGSALFSIYVDAVADYDRVYGSLGGVAVFMLWLYMSAYAVLLGAELNAEIERQATR